MEKETLTETDRIIRETQQRVDAIFGITFLIYLIVVFTLLF